MSSILVAATLFFTIRKAVFRIENGLSYGLFFWEISDCCLMISAEILLWSNSQ